jgi:hypothetical protein
MCGIGPWSDFCNDDPMATLSGRTQLRYDSLSSQPRRNADGPPLLVPYKLTMLLCLN